MERAWVLSSRWPRVLASLWVFHKPQSLKNENLWQSEFLKESLTGKALLSVTFPIPYPLDFPKNSNCCMNVNSRDLKLQTYVVSLMRAFHFWHSLSYSPQWKKKSQEKFSHVAPKDLLKYVPFSCKSSSACPGEFVLKQMRKVTSNYIDSGQGLRLRPGKRHMVSWFRPRP